MICQLAAEFDKMTYQETLQYLYEQLPMFQRVGAVAFKKDLGNIVQLCSALGNPHLKFRAVHIAGTNGKGSTAHLLSSVFQAAGFKTGLYTSPHYKDFRERIKINGQYIPQKKVIQFVAEHKSLLEEIRPSFFEITVALAFQYFAEQKVEIAIIETGLGGRLDSTNIIQPLLSIITNISFDHQQFLGDTLPKIAAEKAGIIKQNTPVLIGEYQEEVAEVFQAKAAKEKAPLSFARDLLQVSFLNENLDYSHYKIDSTKYYFHQIQVNIHGTYQVKNIQTTLAALQLLQLNYRIFGNKNIESFIIKGFQNLKKRTNYKGRWQIIAQNPTVLCDSAHNKGGLEIVLNAIQKLDFHQLHFVYGTVNDKDLTSVFPMFPKEATYYFAKANIPRGLDAKALKAKASKFALNGRAYSSVKNALRAAKRKASKNDLIFVGGSIFVVAEVI